MPKYTKTKKILKYQNKVIAHIEAMASMTAGQLSHSNFEPVKALTKDVCFLLEAIEIHFNPPAKKGPADAEENKDS